MKLETVEKANRILKDLNQLNNFLDAVKECRVLAIFVSTSRDSHPIPEFMEQEVIDYVCGRVEYERKGLEKQLAEL